MRVVVTAGAQSADIDVLGCAVAYAELLRLEGDDAVAVIPGSFTSSVTPSLLSLDAQYERTYTPTSSDRFVLVDISDPDYFPSFVAQDFISEVFDHRHGHEEYWRERLREDAHIEMVGSCGTLIWEQFKKRGRESEISVASAKLLLAAIVSNNLAFQSPLATDRDRVAYAELSAVTHLGDSWVTEYFVEQEKIFLDDFERYVRADVKVFKVPSGDFVIGQIEMWNADEILNTHKEELEKIMSEFNPLPWVVNILNISRGFNFVYSTSVSGRQSFEEKLHIKFDGDVARTENLLMRKYLTKILRS